MLDLAIHFFLSIWEIILIRLICNREVIFNGSEFNGIFEGKERYDYNLYDLKITILDKRI